LRLVYFKTLQIRRIHTSIFLVALALALMKLDAVWGTTHEKTVTSWAIANRVIVIDPGHGGIDPGAVGSNGVREKDIVLQVGKRLNYLLNEAGAKVIITRQSDTDLSTPGSGSLLARKREDLNKRVELAHKNKADFYLSIHANAFPASRWRGAQTFYQSNQPEGKKLAEAIQSELVRIMGNTTRTAKPGDFYTTRNTRMAAVIVEIGFISNPQEAALMADPAYQRKLAYAIYSGLVKHYTEQINNSGNKVIR